MKDYNYYSNWSTFNQMVNAHSTKHSLDVWVSIYGNEPVIGVITAGTFKLSSAFGNMRELALDCEDYFQINDTLMPRGKGLTALTDKVLFKLVKPVKAPVIASKDNWITYNELLDTPLDVERPRRNVWISFDGDVYGGIMFRGHLEFDNQDQEFFHNFLNSEDVVFKYVGTPPPPPKRFICEDISL
tara:strand:- start:1752 stop:2309 length:558 start_codon:yes stop_codon:yes gene_type:complete